MRQCRELGVTPAARRRSRTHSVGLLGGDSADAVRPGTNRGRCGHGVWNSEREKGPSNKIFNGITVGYYNNRCVLHTHHRVILAHDTYTIIWKCRELELFFYPFVGA